jgi:hypothetical protein
MVVYLLCAATTIIFCGIAGIIITTLLNLKRYNDGSEKHISKT